METLRQQGKLDSKLLQSINQAQTKAELEDLYAPFKKKRKTRADMARERGLEKLAKLIIAQPRHGNPHHDAQRYINTTKGVNDALAALAGARDIVAESLASDPENRTFVRQQLAHKRIPLSAGAQTYPAVFSYMVPVRNAHQKNCDSLYTV